jgi:methylmalonyl-CoA mutase cobalamin-binding domain/chain
MKAGMIHIEPILSASGIDPLGKVVMGTVKGDLHDIGKGLVASMLEGAGFEVIDLGVDVPYQKFVDQALAANADIIALSALLTTTMTGMKAVIEALNACNARQRVKVIIGGAAVTQQFADSIGADGYAANANAGVALARKLVAA